MTLNEIHEKIKELKLQKDLVKGTKCEVYSRVVGYLRPVASWNEGKREEFKTRKNYCFYK
ncbi:anaerobic ribonucleoside-triphosphate reductase [Candidatus Endomicrobiellum agilis]|jgi:anaerobic ribonucleoside-triphosphate reductase|uniref:anaerobic ribonucleoside-triphosphate reductase n=1 Tax=Candidatus Endomicrobiellum agilis TaxID=3238957 RepID=UPI00357612D9|nr:anaerobic ribonucleoside-triphosphate reductase [Endomicrobium sp.]MCA6084673.1 anaerobic ribonucleoside-triphosphate reductase [Endomicrobium sp.]